MTWHLLRPAGATRHLWVYADGESGAVAPGSQLADGRDFYHALGEDGPVKLGFRVWWSQDPESRGTVLTDMLWEGGASGIKLVSARLTGLLVELDPTLEVTEAEIRLRSGDTVPGYFAVLETVGTLSPVHSYKLGGRASPFVVSDEVRERVRAGKFQGLDWDPVKNDVPFPGDEPLEELWPL